MTALFLITIYFATFRFWHQPCQWVIFPVSILCSRKFPLRLSIENSQRQISPM